MSTPTRSLFVHLDDDRRPASHMEKLSLMMAGAPSPEVAALSMSGSTLIVAINALLLKRTKLAGIRQPGKASPFRLRAAV